MDRSAYGDLGMSGLTTDNGPRVHVNHAPFKCTFAFTQMVIQANQTGLYRSTNDPSSRGVRRRDIVFGPTSAYSADGKTLYAPVMSVLNNFDGWTTNGGESLRMLAERLSAALQNVDTTPETLERLTAHLVDCCIAVFGFADSPSSFAQPGSIAKRTDNGVLSVSSNGVNSTTAEFQIRFGDMLRARAPTATEVVKRGLNNDLMNNGGTLQADRVTLIVEPFTPETITRDIGNKLALFRKDSAAYARIFSLLSNVGQSEIVAMENLRRSILLTVILGTGALLDAGSVVPNLPVQRAGLRRQNQLPFDPAIVVPAAERSAAAFVQPRTNAPDCAINPARILGPFLRDATAGTRRSAVAAVAPDAPFNTPFPNGDADLSENVYAAAATHDFTAVLAELLHVIPPSSAGEEGVFAGLVHQHLRDERNVEAAMALGDLIFDRVFNSIPNPSVRVRHEPGAHLGAEGAVMNYAYIDTGSGLAPSNQNMFGRLLSQHQILQARLVLSVMQMYHLGYRNVLGRATKNAAIGDMVDLNAHVVSVC